MSSATPLSQDLKVDAEINYERWGKYIMHKLFISHKHEDVEIADTVAWAIDRHASGKVQIHHSSNASYVGPNSAAFLNSSLVDWLAKADGFMLIYTSSERDWSYCMYEYGVVSHPGTVPTSCYVLQCTLDKPAVIQGHVMIRAQDYNSILRFTKDFFCGTPFPSQTQPFCSWSEKFLDEVARDLFNRLQLAIRSKQKKRWTNLPRLLVTLPMKELNKYTHISGRSSSKAIIKLLLERAIVMGASNCTSLFDYVDVDKPVPFKKLIESWRNEVDQSPDPWLQELSNQIVRILEEKPGITGRAPIIASSDRRRRQMVITHASGDEADLLYEFEVFFLDFSDPKSVLVEDIMIPISQISYRVLFGADKRQMLLSQLLEDMEINQQERVILLWENKSPAYVVEPDDIYRFLIKDGSRTDKDQSMLSMDDLLHDSQSDEKLRRSHAVVSPGWSLADARRAMDSVGSNCKCAFVTIDGKLGSQALGILVEDTKRSI